MKVRVEYDKDGKIISVPDPYNGGSINKYNLDEIGQMLEMPPHELTEERKSWMREYLDFYDKKQQEKFVETIMARSPNSKGNGIIDTIYSKAILGIDPGKSGGLVVICDDEVVFKSIMPISGDSLDIKGLCDLITELTRQYNLIVVLEEVHSIFGSSAGSNFTFGFVCGAIEAVVVSCKLKLIKVQPKAWQKQLWANSDVCYKPKKPEQKNASVDTKASSLNCAKRLFPNVDFRKSNSARVTKDHDGIVDACLLAEYGRIKNL